MKELSDGLLALSNSMNSCADAISHFDQALRKVNNYFHYLAFIGKLEKVKFWKSMTLGLTILEKRYQFPSYEKYVNHQLLREIKIKSPLKKR